MAEPTSSASAPSVESPLRAGLRSARATAVPGGVLVSAAAALVILYYQNTWFHGVLEQVAAFRMRWGLAYSIGATSLFAGVVPFLYLHFNRSTARAHPSSGSGGTAAGGRAHLTPIPGTSRGVFQ